VAGEPLVSVVIPTYNNAHLVPDAVRSVLGQTYGRVEVIVVDDGSTDDTRSRLAEFGSKIGVVREERRGPAVARNTGIQASTGEIVAFLDSDDIWMPDKLEKCVAVLQARPEVGVVYTALQIQEMDTGRKYVLPQYTLDGWMARELFLECKGVNTSTLVARRRCLDEVGGFDEDFFRAQDWDLMLRLAEKFQYARVPDVLTERRLHKDALSVTHQDLYAKYNLLVIEKAIARRPILYTGLRGEALSRAHCRFALAHYRDFRLAEARREFRKSLSHRWNARAFNYLLRTFLPVSVVRSLRRIRTGRAARRDIEKDARPTPAPPPPPPLAEGCGKVLLVDPPSVSPNELNLGLASIAAVLRERGHQVRVLDLNSRRVPGSRRKRVRAALDWGPDVLGVSVFPACALTYEGARNLLREARSARGDRTLYVAGGVGISISPAEAARKFQGLADLCVYGEGELTFAEIVEKRMKDEPLTGIQGTVRFVEGEPALEAPREFIRDLDSLPFPAYDLFDSVGETMSEYPIMTSRGCPFNCVFCLNKTLTKRTFRPRSARNVVEEIVRAKERYQFDAVYIWDDHFSLIRERAEEICRLLIEKDLNITYYLPDGIRADSVTPEFAALLKKSGCAGVSVGFEDANPDTFVYIKKGERYEQIVQAIGILKEAGVAVRCSMIIGLMHTTYRSTRVAMENMSKLGVHTEWYLASPFPGTEFYDWVMENGRLLEDPLSLRALTFRRVVFDTPEFPKRDRYRAFYEAFAHYSFPENAFYGKVCNPLTQQRYRFEKYFLSIFTVARYIPERLPSHLVHLARDLFQAVFRRAGRMFGRMLGR